MRSKMRDATLLFLIALNCGGNLLAQVTAKLTVTGAEQAPGGVWDNASLTVSFNGFSETVNYGQFSSPASLAAGLAAMFCRDYLHYGLYAKAGANANSDLNVVTFQMTNGQAFGPISYVLPPTSFALAPSGFGSTTSVLADTGTVTLQVSGAAIASARYAEGATPTSIAQDLASASSSNLVTVKADGSSLYVTSKQTGSAANYPYSIVVNHDTADFPNASFQITPATGNLTGGADQATQSASVPVYGYSIMNSSGGSGYDAAGNLLNVVDSVMGTWRYGYDNFNRLTNAQTNSGAYPNQDFCWSYDSFGNRTNQAASNQPFVSASGGPCQPAGGASYQATRCHLRCEQPQASLLRCCPTGCRELPQVRRATASTILPET